MRLIREDGSGTVQGEEEVDRGVREEGNPGRWDEDGATIK